MKVAIFFCLCDALWDDLIYGVWEYTVYGEIRRMQGGDIKGELFVSSFIWLER